MAGEGSRTIVLPHTPPEVVRDTANEIQALGESLDDPGLQERVGEYLVRLAAALKGRGTVSRSAAASWARGEGIFQVEGLGRRFGFAGACLCPRPRWPASNTCDRDIPAASEDLCAECYDAGCTTDEARCG